MIFWSGIFRSLFVPLELQKLFAISQLKSFLDRKYGLLLPLTPFLFSCPMRFCDLSSSILNSCFITLLVFLPFSSIESQNFPPQTKSFLPKDHEFDSQVLCSELLPKGRIAFGALGQLMVHDGEGFHYFRVGFNVFSMDSDPKGRLYVGGESEFGVMKPDSSGTLTYRSFLDLLPDSLRNFRRTWNTYAVPGEGVYFNVNERIYHYQGDSIEVIRPEDRFLLMHRSGKELFVQDKGQGLFRIREGEKELLLGTASLGAKEHVHGILPAHPSSEDKDGENDPSDQIIMTINGGFYRYDPQKGEMSDFPADPALRKALEPVTDAEPYTAAALDPKKNPYRAAYAVGTRLEGVFLLSPEGEILVQIGPEEGLPAALVWDLLPNEQGDLWVSTNKGIALSRTGSAFTLIEEGDRFQGGVNHIESLPVQPLSIRSGEDQIPVERSQTRNALFLATGQGTWVRNDMDGDLMRVEGTEGQCTELLPFTMKGASSKNGTHGVLVANSRQGVHFLAPAPNRASAWRPTLVSSRNVVSLDRFPLPGQGDEEGVVGGGPRGIYFFAPGQGQESDGEWRTLLSIEDEFPEPIYHVAWGSRERSEDTLTIWGGMSSQGVVRIRVAPAFDDYSVTRFDQADGLPSGSIRPFPDPKEEGLVFGTDSGLYRFEEGRFVPDERFGHFFYETGNQIFRMESASEGELWVIDETEGGVKHFIPENGSYRIDSISFREMELRSARSILPERDRVWIGGDQGLASYFPDLQKDRDREWHCHIRKVLGPEDSLLFGGFYGESADPPDGRNEKIPVLEPVDEQPEGMRPTLPYSQNRLKFFFAAPFSTRQEAVEYSFKLEGFDTSWSRWTMEAKKEYTNLPEGDHRFEVKARNVFLNESRTASYEFTVLPPWYRTWTAYGIYTIGAFGSLWLLLWFNSKRLIAKQERLERVVEERTEEVREKNLELEEEKRMVEEAHREITESIDYASKIQDAVLQPEEGDHSRESGHFIFFKPKAKVSGDLYWVKEHQGHLYVAAVDCTGHGVPGAFMSILGISQLNEILNTKELLSAGDVLTRLRDRVVRELKGGEPEGGPQEGMVAALVRISLEEERKEEEDERVRVQFAGARRPLCVVRRGIGTEHIGAREDGHPMSKEKLEYRIRPFKNSDDGIEVRGDDSSVGFDEKAEGDLSTVELDLQSADMLYLFSNGYADQFGGPKGKKYRYGPFKQFLVSIHEKALEAQKEELERDFEAWKEESQQEQIDDVLVIGVRV